MLTFTAIIWVIGLPFAGSYVAGWLAQDPEQGAFSTLFWMGGTAAWPMLGLLFLANRVTEFFFRDRSPVRGPLEWEEVDR